MHNALLGIGDELTKNLWVSIKERTGTGDIVVRVCYSLSDQEEQVVEAFQRQLKAASHFQVLVLQPLQKLLEGQHSMT